MVDEIQVEHYWDPNLPWYQSKRCKILKKNSSSSKPHSSCFMFSVFLQKTQSISKSPSYKASRPLLTLVNFDMAPNFEEPKRKTISLYDLTWDNLGAVTSHPLLNGNKYEEWAIILRMTISSRKKFVFLDGCIPKPTVDSSYLEDWTTNNHLLVGWIKQTIQPKLRSTILSREVLQTYETSSRSASPPRVELVFNNSATLLQHVNRMGRQWTNTLAN